MDSQNSSPNHYSPLTPAKSRITLALVFGIPGAVIVIAALLIMAYTNVKYQMKTDSMTASADRIIPESDWVEDQRLTVSGGSTCVSFDQDCHVLHRSWDATEPVDIEKMAEQLGIPMEHTQYPEDCMRSTSDGGRTEICAYESPSLGNWQVSLRIRES